MANELLFRVLFSILWIVFISNLTWVRNSLREPKSERSNDRTARRESRLLLVALALFAPFWFGGIILYIIIPSWIAFLSIPLPDWFRLVPIGHGRRDRREHPVRTMGLSDARQELGSRLGGVKVPA
jgi:fatty acid desaturase